MTGKDLPVGQTGEHSEFSKNLLNWNVVINALLLSSIFVKVTTSIPSYFWSKFVQILHFFAVPTNYLDSRSGNHLEYIYIWADIRLSTHANLVTVVHRNDLVVLCHYRRSPPYYELHLLKAHPANYKITTQMLSCHCAKGWKRGWCGGEGVCPRFHWRTNRRWVHLNVHTQITHRLSQTRSQTTNTSIN